MWQLMLAALLAAPAAKDFEPGKMSSIEHEEFRYALRVPKGKTPAGGWPTILFIHGSNMRGENYVGSLETADRLDEWLLIGPTGPLQESEHAFHHNPGDERYVEKVLDDVDRRLKVKVGRLYVGGHSQGGFLSHAVAQHLPERVDGVLAMSGGTWATPRKLMKKGKGRSGEPIPVAIVHAQNDPVVDFRASVSVYDAYVKAKHPAVRLFGPTAGAHMFMRLPVLPALDWLDLMNETDEKQVREVLRETDRDEDPHLAWSVATLLSALEKGKSKTADQILEAIEEAAAEKAKDLAERLSKVRGPLPPELEQEAWTFLVDYGMVEADGAWRKAFDKARGKN